LIDGAVVLKVRRPGDAEVAAPRRALVAAAWIWQRGRARVLWRAGVGSLAMGARASPAQGMDVLQPGANLPADGDGGAPLWERLAVLMTPPVPC
jgi:hypothetical protein